MQTIISPTEGVLLLADRPQLSAPFRKYLTQKDLLCPELCIFPEEPIFKAWLMGAFKGLATPLQF